MGDRVGQQLGNYRLTRLLGRGGFAEVYLGEHMRLGTYAAVKILYTRLASRDEVEDFQKEARTIAHLEHPHIVRVFDFDVVDDTPFLVMSYAAHGTLRQRYPKGSILPLPTIVSYVRQVADALQYAHDQRLIHRDVKPENMLLGQRDELLLSDFGIAIVAQSSRYQGTQDMAGTIAYMAPEQIQAHPRPASDQYSLGIVVYEWLCGDRPFSGSYNEIAVKHTLVPPPSLREKFPTLPPTIEQVVMTALAKDPKQRFESVLVFASALEQASQSTVASSWHIPPGFTPSPQPPRSSGLLMPAGESVISTELIKRQQQPVQPAEIGNWPNQTSGPDGVRTPMSQIAQPTGAYLNRTHPAQPPAMVTPLPASQQHSTLFPPGDLPHRTRRGIPRRTIILGLGLAGLAVAGGGIVWLASSRGLLFPAASSQTPPPILQNTLTPASSPSPTPIPIPIGTLLYVYRGHSSWVEAVEWSPDGKLIASGGYSFPGNDRTVQVWNAANGNRVYTYRGHTQGVTAVAWSPNGKHIASGSNDNTVQVWNATNGGRVYTYHGHADAVWGVAWSPDGKRIASGGNGPPVDVWDAVNGELIFTYHLGGGAVAWSPDGKRIAAGGDKSVHVWDAADGSNVFIYRGHSDFVNAVAWSPDGRLIASASQDSTVQVWNATNGSHVYTYRGHSSPGAVYSVAWSPNGKRIVSGGDDHTAQVWDAIDGDHAYTYRWHSSILVLAVAWSPDGTRIASASDDNTVQIWGAG
jgi:WD40 repeat protein